MARIKHQRKTGDPMRRLTKEDRAKYYDHGMHRMIQKACDEFFRNRGIEKMADSKIENTEDDD